MMQAEFPEDTEALRRGIIETARSMNTQRLNVNKSGNVSARCQADDGELAFLISNFQKFCLHLVCIERCDCGIGNDTHVFPCKPLIR